MGGVPVHRLRRRLAAATVACLLAGGVAAAPLSAQTGVGAGGYVVVGQHELDLGLVQSIQSALRSQFVGVEVGVVRGRLVLSGYASPGAHSAVLAIVGQLLQNPVPVPIALDVVGPGLGLPLPLLVLGAEVEVPDLSGVVAALGVVDKIRIAR
ncbi:MAG TPA: hypothetical protein VM390_04805 [Acidimicrobiales bacterium]|nr:hypothetical protein [Acidimicrobiales bacterium]